MNKEQDHIRDLADIRSMMERSSKFLSLSGWAGVMAGIYALAGAYIAYDISDFNPQELSGPLLAPASTYSTSHMIILAMVMLVLAIGTAAFFSSRKASRQGEKAWNATSRRMLVHTAVPLVTGGILILVMLSKDLTGLIAPLTLVFYGLAHFNAGKFTYHEVKVLGINLIVLGLLGAIFIQYSLLLWAIGFGVMHIIYGVFIHFRYER